MAMDLFTFAAPSLAELAFRLWLHGLKPQILPSLSSLGLKVPIGLTCIVNLAQPEKTSLKLNFY